MALLTPPRTPTGQPVTYPSSLLCTDRLSSPDGSLLLSSLSRKRTRWDCHEGKSRLVSRGEEIAGHAQKVEAGVQTAAATLTIEDPQSHILQLRAELLQESKARIEALEAYEREKAAKEKLEKELSNLRQAHALVEQQCAAAQLWTTQAASYYEDVRRQAEASVTHEREQRVHVEKLLNEERTHTKLLKAQLNDEKSERLRVEQMLDIETVGRTRVEQLLEGQAKAYKLEQRMAAETRAAKASLEQEVTALRARLNAEAERYAEQEQSLSATVAECSRLKSLLGDIQRERQAPFIVPGILDVLTVVSSLTDDVVAQCAA